MNHEDISSQVGYTDTFVQSAVFHFSHSKWHLALQKGRFSLVFYRIDRIIYLQVSAIFRPRRRNFAVGERVDAYRAVHR